jgi:hypothetical protein
MATRRVSEKQGRWHFALAPCRNETSCRCGVRAPHLILCVCEGYMVAVPGTHVKEGRGWHTGRPPAAARTAVVALSSSQGTPSSTSPRVITLSRIESLKDLVEAISRSTPKDTSGPRQQGKGIQVILEVDLKGRTLAAPVLSSPLLIPPGLTERQAAWQASAFKWIPAFAHRHVCARRARGPAGGSKGAG